jgi:hypothetical protein
MIEQSFSERLYPTLCYAAGSCTAELFATPLSTIKTNYQTSNDDRSIIKVAKDIYIKHGVFGFYNSVIPAVFARLVSSFVKFLIYSEIKYYRKTSDNDLLNNMLNGCTTGVLSSFAVHPIDVITNYLQRQETINNSLFKRNILYAGFSQTLVRNLVLYSILFPVFDYSKYYTDNNIILSCLITTAISSSILQPVEYLRTNLMAGQLKGGIINSLKNFKSCWKGWYINYFSNATHFTISMYIMHYLKNK